MTIWAILLAVSLVCYIAAGMIMLMGQFFVRRGRSTTRPAVSVIVAARNEDKVLNNCLSALMNQSYADYEIVIANDRSSDGTATILSEWQRRHPRIKVVTIEHTESGWTPKKYALHRAIEASQGALLLFTDADCVVKSSWVETMVSHFDDKTGLVIGFSRVMGISTFDRFQRFDFLAMMTAAVGMTEAGYPFAASGQNMAYRREIFDAVGGFGSIKHRLSGDDVLMLHLIRRLSRWRIRFAIDTSSHVETRPASGWWSFIQQRARWASNGTILWQLSGLFFLYLCAVLLLQWSLLAGVVVSLWNIQTLWIVGFAFVTKSAVDFAITFNGCRILEEKFSGSMFLLWELLQIPYMVLSAALGLAGLFTWKK